MQGRLAALEVPKSAALPSQVVGEDLPYSLPFSKTIFLLEDVDAGCEVVQLRSTAAKSVAAAQKSPERRATSPAAEEQQRPGSPRPGSDSDGDAVRTPANLLVVSALDLCSA